MVYNPPDSFTDALNDALAARDQNQPFEELLVPGIGYLQARKPRPCAVGALGNAVNAKAGDKDRNHYIGLFVNDHLDDESWDRVMVGMMTGELSKDAVHDVCKALATWGTSRPYIAIINLASLTAHHWRTVRRKLMADGISNPMLDLPTVHMLLDATEQLVLESFVSNKPAKDKADRERFLDSLYRPTPEAIAISGDGYKPIPAGFDDGGEDEWDWAGGAEVAD